MIPNHNPRIINETYCLYGLTNHILRYLLLIGNTILIFMVNQKFIKKAFIYLHITSKPP